MIAWREDKWREEVVDDPLRANWNVVWSARPGHGIVEE